MFSSSGKKKEIFIDLEAIKKGTSEAKKLLKGIASSVISDVLKAELKKGDYKGLPGEKGDKGETGQQGKPGVKGDKGEQGEQGIPGVKGDKGDKGEQGLTGFQGEKGEQGERGDPGIQGLQGVKGDKGDRGQQGLQGEQGLPGKDGLNGKDGIDGKDSPFCEFFEIAPVYENVTDLTPKVVFRKEIKNELANYIKVKLDLTGKGSSKFLFFECRYAYLYNLGSYELIGKPKEDFVQSSSAKLLQGIKVDIQNGILTVKAIGLENSEFIYSGSIQINGAKFI